MARKARNSTVLKKVCARLIELLHQELNLTLAEAARELNYANQTVITQVRKGERFIDIVRLSEFATYVEKKHKVAINLDWVLTGRGARVLDITQQAGWNTSPEAYLIKTYTRMSPSRQKALLLLMGQAEAA